MFPRVARLRGVLLCAAVALVVARAPAQSPQQAPDKPDQDSATLYTRACAKLRAGDTPAAIALLKQTVAAEPDRTEYVMTLSDAHIAADEVSDARELLSAFCRRNPHDIAARKALARLHAGQAAWKDVIATLASAEDNLDADAAMMLARAYERTSQTARRDDTLRTALKRHPTQLALWLAWVDVALDQGLYAAALQRIYQAQRRTPPAPQLQFRAAQAYFHMGRPLGKVEVRRVAGGRVGRFAGEYLLLEERDGADRFLCCPEASAFYQLRRALDGGLDEPAAHLLHARLWQAAGRPRTGLNILKSRAAVLLDPAITSDEILSTYCSVALSADALEDYLRYARRRAARDPLRREQVLFEAYLAAANRYNERGEGTLYLAFVRRALELRADDADLALRVADAEWAADRHDEAAQLYRRVLTLKPAHAARHRILQRLAVWADERAEAP